MWMSWLMPIVALAALPDSALAQTQRRGARSATPDFAARVLRETAVVVSIVAMRSVGAGRGRMGGCDRRAIRPGAQPDRGHRERDAALPSRGRWRAVHPDRRGPHEFPVSSVAEFEAMLASIPIGRSPALLVRRSGAVSYITVTSQPR